MLVDNDAGRNDPVDTRRGSVGTGVARLQGEAGHASQRPYLRRFSRTRTEI